VYFPVHVQHTHLRIRRSGDDYELTKKTSLDPNGQGQQREENIALSAEEYQSLSKGESRTVSKVRYYMPYQGHTAVVEIFTGKLEGLVTVEAEFDTVAEKDAFLMPDFCLADITQDEAFAGGVLAGKSYDDVSAMLARYHYKRLHFPTSGE
jgi:CYTH domain-containing protein